MIIITDRDTLLDVVREAMSEIAPRPKEPALLDRRALAQALDISLPSLDRLRRKKGFPQIHVGDVPRFRLEEVLRWLRR